MEYICFSAKELSISFTLVTRKRSKILKKLSIIFSGIQRETTGRQSWSNSRGTHTHFSSVCVQDIIAFYV